jgi:2-oxoglutarate ferredoxin oxidoreductase subunit delta
MIPSEGIDFKDIKLYNKLFHWSRITFTLLVWRRILATGMIEIDSDLCKDCKLCISVCPHRLIESSDRMNQKGYYPAIFVEKHLKKEGKKCTGCGLCAIICPEIAIEVYRA